ncbi:hypothetical protein WDW37_18150 [Bdellovibrionota bacterium FG-1]
MDVSPSAVFASMPEGQQPERSDGSVCVRSGSGAPRLCHPALDHVTIEVHYRLQYSNPNPQTRTAAYSERELARTKENIKKMFPRLIRESESNLRKRYPKEGTPITEGLLVYPSSPNSMFVKHVIKISALKSWRRKSSKEYKEVDLQGEDNFIPFETQSERIMGDQSSELGAIIDSMKAALLGHFQDRIALTRKRLMRYEIAFDFPYEGQEQLRAIQEVIRSHAIKGSFRETQDNGFKGFTGTLGDGEEITIYTKGKDRLRLELRVRSSSTNKKNKVRTDFTERSLLSVIKDVVEERQGLISRCISVRPDSKIPTSNTVSFEALMNALRSIVSTKCAVDVTELYLATGQVHFRDKTPMRKYASEKAKLDRAGVLIRVARGQYGLDLEKLFNQTKGLLT